VRVLVVAPFFPPDPAGSGVFAYQQAVSLAKRGHKVLVVTNTSRRWSTQQGLSSPTLLDGIDVIRIKGFRIGAGSLTWNYRIPFSFPGLFTSTVREKLSAFQPDRAIVHSVLFDLSLWGLWHSWRRLCSSVLIVHTALWHQWRLVRFAMAVYSRYILRPLIRRANSKVVCVDDWTYSNSQSLVGRDESVTVIPVSITPTSMRGGDGAAIRKRYELGDGPLLLSLGHVVRVRDRMRLIRSLPLIAAKHPNVKVVVVGTPFETRFLELAEELGVRHHVVVVGAVNHEQIRDFLAAADLEAHDLDGRGLGITSIEAMDAQVPIVAWVNRTVPPHDQLLKYEPLALIDDGEPETIAEMVHRLLSDNSFRRRVIATQDAVVREIFSEDTATRRYLELLAE
jgi:glycosyltransferase involved in cell wall biosynthesis